MYKHSFFDTFKVFTFFGLSLGLLFLLLNNASAQTVMVTTHRDYVVGDHPEECTLRKALNSVRRVSLEIGTEVDGCSFEDLPDEGDDVYYRVMFEESITHPILMEIEETDLPAGSPDHEYGDFDIDLFSVYIQGNGKDKTIIDAQHFDGVFDVGSIGSTDRKDVFFYDLTIENGNRDTSSSDFGGAIRNINAFVGVTNAKIKNNYAQSAGGGIFSSNSSSENRLARVRIENTEFDNNHSGQYGGSIHNQVRSSLSLIESSIYNSSSQNGGAISNVTGSSAELDKTDIAKNKAIVGGGIYNYSSRLNTVESKINNNNAEDTGGAIYNYRESILYTFYTQISGNAAYYSSGIHNAQSNAEIFNTEISYNGKNPENVWNPIGEEAGGFMNLMGGTMYIENSTLAFNQTNGRGAAFYNVGGEVGFSFSTIAHNISFGENSQGEEGYDLADASLASEPSGATTFGKTIIDSNGFSFNCDLRGSTTSNKYNFVWHKAGTDSSCALTDPTDSNSVNPKLDNLLQKNGGPTRTLKMEESSPLFDIISFGLGECTVMVDQRGGERGFRLSGNGCEPGAYEVGEF